MNGPRADQIRGVLEPHLSPLGALPDAWSERLETYLRRLLERNHAVNLISRSSADRVLQAQLLPSLAIVSRVAAGKSLSVLDIGSGGGFPAIPLAIVRPAGRYDLAEATRKKVEFLDAVIRELDLPARAHWCRIEDPTPELTSRGAFDVIVTRAVGSPAKIASAARPFLASGGEAWRFCSPEEGQILWPEAAPLTALSPLIG